jgi:hypothetical protein
LLTSNGGSSGTVTAAVSRYGDECGENCDTNLLVKENQVWRLSSHNNNFPVKQSWKFLSLSRKKNKQNLPINSEAKQIHTNIFWAGTRTSIITDQNWKWVRRWPQKGDGKKTHGAKNQSSNTRHIKIHVAAEFDGRTAFVIVFLILLLPLRQHTMSLSLRYIYVFVLVVVHKIYIYNSCSLCKGSIVCSLSVSVSVCVYVYIFRLESVCLSSS